MCPCQLKREEAGDRPNFGGIFENPIDEGLNFLVPLTAIIRLPIVSKNNIGESDAWKEKTVLGIA
jgi:hypothetical protein